MNMLPGAAAAARLFSAMSPLSRRSSPGFSSFRPSEARAGIQVWLDARFRGHDNRRSWTTGAHPQERKIAASGFAHAAKFMQAA